MRLAVIDLVRHGSVADDVAALADAAMRACSAGADAIVAPAPRWFAESGADQAEVLGRVQALCPDAHFVGLPCERTELDAAAGPHDGGRACGASFERTPLGMTASVAGDDCLDLALARELQRIAPDAVVLRPDSESELQAEAMIERAIALSESVSGLIIIAEADGATAGDPGHGGSAIAVLGELVAEHVADEDLLLADLAFVPVPAPEPRDPVPSLPPILEQRLSRHRGRLSEAEPRSST